MNEPQHSPTPLTPREQELELEVARLTAELEALRGDDPTAVTSRFLAMAATTVDQAVADARREADELAAEISAEAEARRDEASRLAAEAEAKAEQLEAEAARAQDIVDEAHQQAETIRVAALDEATKTAATERARVQAEIASLTEVRTSLESERASLESYHEELGRRVQDMAESMMAFMTTEPPILGGTALAAPLLAAPEAEAEDEDADADAWLEAVAAVPDDPGFTEALAAAIEPTDADTDADPDADEGTDEAEAPGEDFAGVPVVDDEVAEPAGATGLFASAADEDPEPTPRSLFGAHGPRYLEQTPPSDLADALDDDGTATDEAFEEFLSGDGEPDPSRDWLLRPEQT